MHQLRLRAPCGRARLLCCGTGGARAVACGRSGRARERFACSTVEFIGVRGSGESYSGNYGMGTQIGNMYERVKARKPSSQSLQSYGLEYQAVNVAEWWKAWDYFFSVWEGDEHLESRIKSDASGCPSMEIARRGLLPGRARRRRHDRKPHEQKRQLAVTHLRRGAVRRPALQPVRQSERTR